MAEEQMNQEQLNEEMNIDPKQFEEVMKAFAKLKVFDLIAKDINEFIQKAWMNMGLVPPFGEKEPVVDMEEAKLAIDCVEFLAKQIEGKLKPEEAKELNRVVADLKINFVKKTTENK